MTLPTYFISHGGGPWPYLTGPMRDSHRALEASLQDMPRQLAALGHQPKAVLMVSAHWQEPAFTVMANPHPGMLYDYGGFPASTYTVKYPAPGSPALAERVRSLVTAAGMVCRTDTQRGFDHGTFVPMQVMYPDADLPLLQLSMQNGYDPQAHIDLGRALAPLRDEGVLIIGSGLSYHNMRMFGPAAQTPSKAFDGWLNETLAHTPPPERATRLAHWADAPGARQSHPQEDHLIPLMVALGAAQHESATRVYHEQHFAGGAVVSSYRFGGVT